MILDDMQRAVLDPVAQRDYAAHPHSLLFRSRDLISDPLARDFPLELGEGQQHVKGQPSHAGRGVERLGHRHENDWVTDTKETSCLSKVSTSLAKSASERVSRSTL